jgi:hypothetical protein
MAIEYTTINSEPGLWTVGFNKPDGGWEPESDHDSQPDAQRRAGRLNGNADWPLVYIRSEPGLWTSGSYGGDGRWEPDADWASADDAAEHVIETNA